MEENVISNFESEAANLYLEDLSINGFGLIEVAFDRILDEGDRPSLIECEEALVACEIVAAVFGKVSNHAPSELSEWIEMFLPAGSDEYNAVCALAEKAADTIDRILSDSELLDLWSESPLLEEWMQEQVMLQERILD